MWLLPMLLFWSMALTGVMSVALLGFSVRHGRLGAALWAGLSLVLLVASASLLWRVSGRWH